MYVLSCLLQAESTAEQCSVITASEAVWSALGRLVSIGVVATEGSRHLTLEKLKSPEASRPSKIGRNMNVDRPSNQLTRCRAVTSKRGRDAASLTNDL